MTTKTISAGPCGVGLTIQIKSPNDVRINTGHGDAPAHQYGGYEDLLDLAKQLKKVAKKLRKQDPQAAGELE